MKRKGSRKTVLVVDDEAINRLLLVTALKKRSFDTIEAKNGMEALEMVREHHPDLLLLDVMMPDLTGFEVCRTLKDRPGSAYLPIILVTALHSREDVEKGIAAGADEFISKPVDVNELMVRVRTLLKISDLQNVMERNPLIASIGAAEEPELDEDGKQKARESLGSSEAGHLIQSMLKANLTDFGDEINKPSAIHLSLHFESWNCHGKLYRKREGELEELSHPLEFSDTELSGLGSWQEGVFISNWQDYAESPEEYQKLLPPELAAFNGGVKNFILYSDQDQRILFLNFGRRLQLFDLTWYRHLGSYISLLIRIFAKMGEKEEEYLALSRSLAHITEIKDGDPGKHGRIRRVVALLCEQLSCSSGYSMIGKLIEGRKVGTGKMGIFRPKSTEIVALKRTAPPCRS